MLRASAASALALGTGLVRAPAAIAANRPTTPFGVQTGDIAGDRAILWSKTDRPARMIVRWSTTEDMSDANTAPFVNAVEDTDYAAKLDLSGLPAGQDIFYDVQFLDLEDMTTTSEPVTGRFRTPPVARRDIRFVWSGDTAGQGWGINPDFGGMRIYAKMAERSPDFFIHSGDTIYADGPLEAEVTLDDGTVWKNIVTEEKSRVAESLREFRGQYEYNLMDDNVRAFNAAVPMLAQWDDHEVSNNWFWELQKTTDERYKEPSMAKLGARAMRAFHEYMPTRRHPLEPDRLYATFPYGPQLEVFRIDFRSYRGPNTANDQTELGPESRIMGADQIRWLKQSLLASDATWKVIASDMPIGLVVNDTGPNGEQRFEAVAQGDGPARGRELEIAQLLTFIHQNNIKNVVWLTADVHYTAAHRYDPANAQYSDFAPFWEFVSGPLHAGSFGPNALDNTFGPEAVFVKAPPEGQANLPPSAGLQFFGQVDIAGDSDVMTVSLIDIEGETVFSQEITPEV